MRILKESSYKKFLGLSGNVPGYEIGISESGKTISIPVDAPDNRNISVCGPGREKTIENIIRSSIDLGHSVIVADPRGDYTNTFWDYAKEHGYKNIWVFNSFNPCYPIASNSYNPLSNADDSDIDFFTDSIVGDTDRYSYISELMRIFLKAVLLYVKENYPKNKRNFCEVEGLIKNEPELEKAFLKLEKDNPNSKAFRAYQCVPKHEGLTIGLKKRLEVFSEETVKHSFCGNDININKITKEKTIVFCIFPEGTPQYGFLSELFMNTMIKRVFENALYNKKLNEFPVDFVLDADLFTIPAFNFYLATAKAINIGIVFSFQDVSKLSSLWGASSKRFLLMCSYNILLGTDNDITADMYSQLSSQSTIMPRPDMSPEEINNLEHTMDRTLDHPGDALLFTQGRGVVRFSKWR